MKSFGREAPQAVEYTGGLAICVFRSYPTDHGFFHTGVWYIRSLTNTRSHNGTDYYYYWPRWRSSDEEEWNLGESWGPTVVLSKSIWICNTSITHCDSIMYNSEDASCMVYLLQPLEKCFSNIFNTIRSTIQPHPTASQVLARIIFFSQNRPISFGQSEISHQYKIQWLDLSDILLLDIRKDVRRHKSNTCLETSIFLIHW